MSETKYDVVLVALRNRVEIMKAIMAVNPVGLKRSKDMADNPPAVVISGVSRDKAEKAKDILEKAGGTIVIREIQT
ncbi:MAG: hypothetical protein D6737_01430 [Chloroflexi bacterium]|nr:MAG: hypothetical protein D6737_01430 [Chloroflexota bacterium]